MASKPGILRLAFSKFSGRRDLVRDDKGVAKIDGLLLSFCKVFQAIPLRLNREYRLNEYFHQIFYLLYLCAFFGGFHSADSAISFNISF